MPNPLPVAKSLASLALRRRELLLHEAPAHDGRPAMRVLSTRSLHPFNMRGLLRRIFGGERYESRPIGLHRLVALGRLQSRCGASFACFEFPVSVSRVLGTLGGWWGAFLVPWFVETVVDLSAESQRLWSRSARDSFREVPRNGFSYSVSTDRDHFRTFFDDYWRPSIGQRHGDGAADLGYQHLVDPGAPAAAFKGLELLRVFKEDQWVSAILVRTRPGGIPEMLEMGVRHGEASLVKAGAQSALYWASFSEAQRRGHSAISLMWCFPDLAGGTFRYKMHYRPLIRPSRYPLGVCVVPGLRTEAAESFVLNHPFIQLKGGQLAAAFFTGADGQVARSQYLLAEGRLRGLAAPEIRPAGAVFGRRS